MSFASPSDSSRSPWLLLLLACLTWAGIHWLLSDNLDGYHDMAESYVWGQGWNWGTFKHPPFFSWLAAAWFTVFPQSPASYLVLSFTNVAVALLGVVMLGRQLGLPRLAWPAALLLLLALPYTTLAAKFNANVPLLWLWPWAAACMLASWRHGGWRGFVWSSALAAFAAMAMLTKYYSGVFLLGLFLTALLTPDGRRWFLTPRPYWTLALLVALMVPHLLWMREHDWVILRYAEDQGDGEINLHMLLKFALVPLLYWLPAWVLLLVITRKQQANAGSRWWHRAWRSWLPQGWGDGLFWLAFFPWAITLSFGLSGAVELSMPWAIPIGYAFSLLWLRNLAAEPLMIEPVDGRIEDAIRTTLWALPAIALIAAFYAAWRQDEAYYRPDAEAARAMLAWWQQQHPQTPLRWSGGNWATNADLSFYADPSIRALPGFPDLFPATVDPLPGWQQQGGLLVCPKGRVDDIGRQAALERAAKAAKSHKPNPREEASLLHQISQRCEPMVEDWLRRQGRPVQAHRFEATRSGWRFPRPVPFGYTVYSYVP